MNFSRFGEQHPSSEAGEGEESAGVYSQLGLAQEQTSNPCLNKAKLDIGLARDLRLADAKEKQNRTGWPQCCFWLLEIDPFKVLRCPMRGD